jgi:hypothetical protein
MKRFVLRVAVPVGLAVLAVGACSGGSATTQAGTATASSSVPASSVSSAVEPIESCVTPKQQALFGVALPASGGTIEAIIQGAGTTAVIFSTMSDNHLCHWLDTATEYADQGYRTATYEYSGTQRADADLAAVAADLRRRGQRKCLHLECSSLPNTSARVRHPYPG